MSFIPESYLRDPDIFPEKEGDTGSIYIEAADKVSLKKMRDITFVNARDILGIIYVSKSGNTRLKWRESRGGIGKLTGEASTNSLVNLFSARVLSKEYADMLLQKSEQAETQSERAEVAEGGDQEAPVEEEAVSVVSSEGISERTGDEIEGTLNVEGDV